jgi:hypothetical protein
MIWKRKMNGPFLLKRMRRIGFLDTVKPDRTFFGRGEAEKN